MTPAPPEERCDYAGCERSEGHPIHDEEYERGGHDFIPPAPAPLADGDTWCAECGETVPAGDAHQHTDAERAPLADGSCTGFDGAEFCTKAKGHDDPHSYPLADGGEIPRLAQCAGINTDYARGVHVACECVGKEIAALRARVAELERVIEEAPHGRGCGGTKHWTGQPICDCWKSKAKVSG